MQLNFYGFLIGSAILISALVAEKLNQRIAKRVINKEAKKIDIYNLFPWLLIPAIISARLYHVIDYWAYYSQQPIEILFIWQGGLGIFGGIIGGIVGLFLFKQTKKLNQSQFLNLLDIGVISLSLGQAIGRWGNFFNQELYGFPTNLPWAIYIRPENRLPGFTRWEKFHPLFLYESLACLLIFLFLLFIFNKKKPKPGKIFFLYLFLYPLIRFLLEFLRIDSWWWQPGFLSFSLRVNQVVALGLMVASGVFLLRRWARSHRLIT